MFDKDKMKKAVLRGAVVTNLELELAHTLMDFAIDLAFDNLGEYVEVREEDWLAQALVAPDGAVLLSLIKSQQYLTARYMDGHYA